MQNGRKGQLTKIVLIFSCGISNFRLKEELDIQLEMFAQCACAKLVQSKLVNLNNSESSFLDLDPAHQY